jgi:ATP-dependent DNA ligase
MPNLMKGKVWDERKHKMTYPCVAEVKYDEIRVCVLWYKGAVHFLSYAGKPLNNLGQFADGFAEWFNANPQHDSLDCGFEANSNFNDSYRWVRSKGIPDDLIDVPIKFFLFDVPMVDVPYSGRWRTRQVAAQMLNYRFPCEVPEWTLCHDEASVDRAFLKAQEDGYEGLMVKSREHLYHSVPSRTDGWLKMKPEATADGYILRLYEAVSITGVNLGRVGSIGVRVDDGSCASPAGIPHELGTQMFQNPEQYLNQWVEFKYMQRDRAGGYRHPSFIRFREAKV